MVREQTDFNPRTRRQVAAGKQKQQETERMNFCLLSEAWPERDDDGGGDDEDGDERGVAVMRVVVVVVVGMRMRVRMMRGRCSTTMATAAKNYDDHDDDNK